MKNPNKISFAESFRLSAKTFRLLFREYPQMYLSRIVFVAWEALTPYVGIYISALLIGEIASSRDPKRLTVLAVAALIAAALTALGTALLKMWKDNSNTCDYTKISKLYTEKFLNMDFVSVDDPKTHELYSEIMQLINGNGWGLPSVVWQTESLASAVATLFGGVVLTVSLFAQKVPSGNALSVLNNPVCIIALIGVMLAATLTAPALMTKAISYYSQNSDTHNLVNRLFGYYGFCGDEKNIASDMRIYRQDKISSLHIGDKTMAFGSQGFFAKLSKGKVGALVASSSAVSAVFIGIAYLYVCLKALGGAFGVGSVAQYVAALTKMSGGLSKLVKGLGDIKNNAPALKKSMTFFEIPYDMASGTEPVKKNKDNEYVIEFRNVSFKYPASGEYALKDVNIKFRAGEKLAVVGRNGSGKTTFIKLLCRLYDPTEGTILLNGKDIRDYDYSEYLGIFSVVFHDFKLFAFKLGDNVAGRSDYNASLADECLEKAGFADRLKTLEKGEETYLYKEFERDGVDLSGGEAQKVALARALYKNAPFIILDEPTAALDPVAESEIYSNFNSIVGDKTAVYISHRLSSCRFCDDIAVFDGGRLVQRGDHDSLVSDENGVYHALWNAQAQYYTA